MANEESTATDPFGKTVFLLDGIDVSTPISPEFSEALRMVIRKPALLVEVTENEQKHYYYFRSIEWHLTMLILVGFNNNRWETIRYTKNPANEELSQILKRGRQLI
jgi:hypothetical protein